MPLDQPQLQGSGKEMSFLDHLEELRWHIIRALAAVVIAGIGIFLAKSFVFETVLFAPRYESFLTYRFICGISESLCFSPQPFDILPRQLGEQFITHLKVSFMLGLVVAFPYVFWEIWRFVKPGLYKKEQKVTRGVVFICSLLFTSGVLFGYFVISPFAISFLSNYSVGELTVNAPTLTSYVNYMIMFTLPTGLIFELPIVVYFLAKLGILGPKTMRTYRRHALVVILLMAALITPPDVITQFLIAIPLYLLWEASIIIAKRVYKEV